MPVRILNRFVVEIGVCGPRAAGGLLGMPDYRLYCLGGTGHIETAHEIIAGNDEDAIMIARAKKLTVKCELWERGRLVAKIPAHKA